ncbi:MAG: hypothetical protein V7678_12860 [Brevundimonas sp.]
MIIPTRPALSRACQLARSGACGSLDDITDRLSREGVEVRGLLEDADVRRMLRSLMRQAAAVRPGGAEGPGAAA